MKNLPILGFITLAILGACHRQAPKMVEKNIEIVVHRGANHLAPENTIASALAAIEQGAQWVELDVRMSRDSVFYNLHDDTLGRTTNGSGPIGQWLSADIDTLDAGSWFSPRFAGERVPTIEQMIDTLQGQCNFFFDVKRGTPIPQFVFMLRGKGINAGNSFYWFADTAMLREFVALAPDMKIKVNANSPEDVERWKAFCHPAYIETAFDHITPELLDYCHSQDIKVMAAIQEASDSDYQRAIDIAPDLVNIDKPELFSRLMLK